MLLLDQKLDQYSKNFLMKLQQIEEILADQEQHLTALLLLLLQDLQDLQDIKLIKINGNFTLVRCRVRKNDQRHY